MDQELARAFLILGVGMITVFFILGLVVLSGKLLIRVVNRFFPAASIKSPLSEVNRAQSIISTRQQDKKQLAAIIAAVDILTAGKGKVKEIEKVK